MSKRRHNFGTKRFKEKSLFIFHARIALKSLILLFVRLIARGARIEKTHTQTHRQTDRTSTVTLAHARRGLTSTVTLAHARRGLIIIILQVWCSLTTCTLGLVTVVITLGHLASFPSYSCLVYNYDTMIMQFNY